MTHRNRRRALAIGHAPDPSEALLEPAFPSSGTVTACWRGLDPVVFPRPAHLELCENVDYGRPRLRIEDLPAGRCPAHIDRARDCPVLRDSELVLRRHPTPAGVRAAVGELLGDPVRKAFAVAADTVLHTTDIALGTKEHGDNASKGVGK